jgi:hypothetical protein
MDFHEERVESQDPVLGEDSRCVFFNGALHFATSDSHSAYMLDQEGILIRWIVAVDTEGKTWRRIQMPPDIWITTNCKLSVLLENPGRGDSSLTFPVLWKGRQMVTSC